MRAVILLCVFLLSLPALGDPLPQKKKKKKTLDLTPPGQLMETHEDPGSATPLLYADPAKVTPGSAQEDISLAKASARTTCIDGLGMVHAKGDPGYDSCLNTRDTAQPTVPADNRHVPSLGVSVGGR